MFSKIYSAALFGIEGCMIHVEADVSDGLPQMNMVGALGTEVREARDRVWTAIKNLGIHLPAKRITVNLSPADIRKEGTSFDFPIAAAVLVAFGYLPESFFHNTLLAGELSLNGKLCRINGVLPMVLSAKQNGLKKCIVPMENAQEGAVVQGMEVVGIESLQELLELANQIRSWKPQITFSDVICPESAKVFLDFSEVSGQQAAKRAIEIAVAGMHNLLMVGPPGSGKTMLARRIPGIMPNLCFEERLEISKIYSIAGLLKKGEELVRNRPFRAPHHSVSPAALIGGGRLPKPGEISLAGHGVLFLDELTEFQRTTLEMLRQPLEEHTVTISRMNGSYTYPADFILCAAMNPCACGYYPDRSRCRCSSHQIRRYLDKLSRPFLDRIDICVETEPVTYSQLIVKEGSRERSESSDAIRRRVEYARQLQKERYKMEEIRCNGELTPQLLERYAPLGKKEKEYLSKVFDQLSLSARSYHKIIKTARTIADIEESEKITCAHLSEAVCYRSNGNHFW